MYVNNSGALEDLAVRNDSLFGLSAKYTQDQVDSFVRDCQDGGGSAVAYYSGKKKDLKHLIGLRCERTSQAVNKNSGPVWGDMPPFNDSPLGFHRSSIPFTASVIAKKGSQQSGSGGRLSGLSDEKSLGTADLRLADFLNRFGGPLEHWATNQTIVWEGDGKCHNVYESHLETNASSGLPGYYGTKWHDFWIITTDMADGSPLFTNVTNQVLAGIRLGCRQPEFIPAPGVVWGYSTCFPIAKVKSLHGKITNYYYPSESLRYIEMQDGTFWKQMARKPDNVFVDLYCPIVPKDTSARGDERKPDGDPILGGSTRPGGGGTTTGGGGGTTPGGGSSRPDGGRITSEDGGGGCPCDCEEIQTKEQWFMAKTCKNPPCFPISVNTKKTECKPMAQKSDFNIPCEEMDAVENLLNQKEGVNGMNGFSDCGCGGNCADGMSGCGCGGNCADGMSDCGCGGNCGNGVQGLGANAEEQNPVFSSVLESADPNWAIFFGLGAVSLFLLQYAFGSKRK